MRTQRQWDMVGQPRDVAPRVDEMAAHGTGPLHGTDDPPRASQQRGQVAIIFALAAVVIVGILALALDLGYDFVQQRAMQNVADMAALDAANCKNQSVCATNAQVYSTISTAMTYNASVSGATFTANYLTGASKTVGAAVTNDSGQVPTDATGVQVSASAHFPGFFGAILHVGGFTAVAQGSATLQPQGITPQLSTSTPTPSGPTATNTPGPSLTPTATNTPGGPTATPTTCATDICGPFNPAIVSLAPSGNHTVFTQSSGKFIVEGDIFADSSAIDSVDTFNTSSITVTTDPLLPATPQTGVLIGVSPNPPDLNYIPLTPLPTGTPFPPPGPACLTRSGSQGAVYCYQYMQSSQPYYSDPFYTMITPTTSLAADSVSCAPNGNLHPDAADYYPGHYTTAVTGTTTITGTVTFHDCNGSPGIYYLDKGLTINATSSTAVVNASNVMFFSNSGNGFSIGGVAGSTLNFTGITLSSSYSHMVFFQDRATAGNVNFNPSSGQAATINITGTVYAHNSTTYGDCVTGGASGCKTAGGGGNITIDGTVVTDKFYTAGSANMTIIYDPNQVPLRQTTGSA